jgi:hypothetical protein
VFELPSNCSIHVKWSPERIVGIADAELLLAVLLFACARACGTRSSATAAKSNEPHNLIAFLLNPRLLFIGLGITR